MMSRSGVCLLDQMATSSGVVAGMATFAGGTSHEHNLFSVQIVRETN